MGTKRSTRGQVTVAAVGLAAEQAGGSTTISDRRGEGLAAEQAGSSTKLVDRRGEWVTPLGSPFPQTSRRVLCVLRHSCCKNRGR